MVNQFALTNWTNFKVLTVENERPMLLTVGYLVKCWRKPDNLSYVGEGRISYQLLDKAGYPVRCCRRPDILTYVG